MARTKKMTPTEAGVVALMSSGPTDGVYLHLDMTRDSLTETVTTVVSAVRDAEYRTAVAAVESETLQPGVSSDLDLLAHLVCPCVEVDCPRRAVVDRLRSRIEATTALARQWQAEAADRSTPDQPDTLLASGAAAMVLYSLGVPKEERRA